MFVHVVITNKTTWVLKRRMQRCVVLFSKANMKTFWNMTFVLGTPQAVLLVQTSKRLLTVLFVSRSLPWLCFRQLRSPHRKLCTNPHVTVGLTEVTQFTTPKYHSVESVMPSQRSWSFHSWFFFELGMFHILHLPCLASLEIYSCAHYFVLCQKLFTWFTL